MDNWSNCINSINNISRDTCSSSSSNQRAMEPITIETLRTCRGCHKQFLPSRNDKSACVYHPESYAGETAQRWLAPGDHKGGAEIHNFYSCCGGDINNPGCCRRRHMTFDEEEDFSQRRPGMGMIDRSSMTDCK